MKWRVQSQRQGRRKRRRRASGTQTEEGSLSWLLLSPASRAGNNESQDFQLSNSKLSLELSENPRKLSLLTSAAKKIFVGLGDKGL